MKVSVRPVKRNAKKVGVTLRRACEVKVVPAEAAAETNDTPVIESLPELFDVQTVCEDIAEPEEIAPEPAVDEVFPLCAPEQPAPADEEDSELDELIEEVDSAIDLADEQFAEMDALVEAQDDDEQPEQDEITMPELVFEQPEVEEIADDTPEVPEAPAVEETAPEVPEEKLPFADGSMSDYESLDVDGDGVPENNVFRRFFDRGRIKSDEKDADGVEYVCVDEKSGMVRKLFGMIKRHDLEEE